MNYIFHDFLVYFHWMEKNGQDISKIFPFVFHREKTNKQTNKQQQKN